MLDRKKCTTLRQLFIYAICTTQHEQLACYTAIMPETLYEKVIRDEIPTYKAWEDEHLLAFLTPFPNTPGVTVVTPKTNPDDYVF